MTQTNLRPLRPYRQETPTSDALTLAVARAAHGLGVDPAGPKADCLEIRVGVDVYKTLWAEQVLGRDREHHVRWKGFRVKCDTRRPTEQMSDVVLTYTESRTEAL